MSQMIVIMSLKMQRIRSTREKEIISTTATNNQQHMPLQALSLQCKESTNERSNPTYAEIIKDIINHHLIISPAEV